MNTNEEKQSQENELNLAEIFKYLLHFLWIIAISAIVFAIIAFSYFRFIKKDQFNAKTSIYVDILSANDTVENSSITVATAIAKDYRYLLTSNRILNMVINDLALENETPDSLKKNISVTIPNDHFIEVSVTGYDPEYASKVANTLGKIATEVLPEYTTLQLKIIDTAETPTEPVSKGTMKYTALFGLLGAFIACVVLVIIYLIDDRIKSPEDIENKLGLSVLGIIPDLQSTLKMNKKTKKLIFSKENKENF